MTLDRVTWHTVSLVALIDLYLQLTPNFVQRTNQKKICGRTDGCIFEWQTGRSIQLRNQPKMMYANCPSNKYAAKRPRRAAQHMHYFLGLAKK